jgi:hypothetical protein
MLVAKRDPFETGAHDRLSDLHPKHDFGAPPVRPPLARAMSAVQMFGALLAIPLGIGSAYTMYHANFAPETACQNLRASIVGMLDKGVDARTRHMLVRRDVEAFETKCGSVDPDATAAFRDLLAGDAAALKRPAVKPVEDKPKEKEIARRAEPKAEIKPEARVETKSEPKPKSEPKAEAKLEPKAETVVAKAPEVTAAPREQLTDTAWLAAVRSALAPKDTDEAKPEVKPAAKPVTKSPIEPPDKPPVEQAAVAPTAPPIAVARPIVHAVAPAEAADVTPPPATPQPATADAAPADGSHPVPPASIPQPVTPPREASRLGSLIEQIPFVGQVIAK